ncbi:MAG: hypothetical protein IJ130_03215, partial [Solobacterium sp.]|nr:hypothetical protein [Eubacterium sp.]MBQ9152803.1 hypothetical protein [Solobacterium sp.]
DLLLLVTDDAAGEAVPEKLFGRDTAAAVVLAGGADCQDPEMTAEQMKAHWEKKGFSAAGIYHADVQADAVKITELALEIRMNAVEQSHPDWP